MDFKCFKSSLSRVPHWINILEKCFRKFDKLFNVLLIMFVALLMWTVCLSCFEQTLSRDREDDRRISLAKLFAHRGWAVEDRNGRLAGEAVISHQVG